MSIDKKTKLRLSKAVELNLKVYKIWWKRYPKRFISSGISAIIEGLSPYVNIYLVALIINELAGDRLLDRLVFLTGLLVASASVLTFLQSALLHWKNYHSELDAANAREIYNDKLLSLDFVDIESQKTIELLATITQNQNWGSWGVLGCISRFESIIRSLMRIVGAIALTVTLFTSAIPYNAGHITVLNNPIFLLLIVAAIIAIALLAPQISNKADEYWTRESHSARMGNRWFSFSLNIAFEKLRQADVRIYRQDKIIKKYMDLTSYGGPLDFFSGIMEKFGKRQIGGLKALSAALSHVLTAIIYIFVCLKAWGGAFAVGNITQYIRAISNLSQGISELVFDLGWLRNNASFLEYTFALLDMPNNMYMGSLTTEKRRDSSYEIEFRNVSFSYPGSEASKPVLKNVSLKFHVGQRLAIVGENGSGKTTFIKLLCRMYDPTEGEILLNGIDIRKYNYGEYMDIFSVVFQDFKLFAQSLGSNVASGVEFDNQKVKDCLEKVGFGEKLSKMPNGLDTYLYKEFSDNGVDISGGEAQKIAMARALYKDAPFIIMDEPTAALDPIAEFEIYSKLSDIVEDKTAVFISHRLSSCRFCENIAVFDNGAVVQLGSHDQLIEDSSGKYLELWNAQAQYYNVPAQQ